MSNKEEISLGTSPNSADTDSDGLSDYDEINTYNTDPLKADSDEDTLSDGDEIAIGLDPNDPETFGVPDAEYKVDQTISADSEIMSRVNTEEAPYELSLEISASGNAAKHLIAGGSIYSSITDSEARLGEAVSLNYFGGEVDKVKLIYEINDEYISNEGSEYAENCLDLQGIKRYNIFRYFEDLNMLLPIVTEFDEESDTLYAETDRLGAYCVLDMEILMQKLGIAPDGTSVENVARQMYSAAPAAAKDNIDPEKYCVTFIFDIRKGIVSSEQLEAYKEYVGGFATEVFAENRDITIRLMTQDVTDFFDDSYKVIGECTNIDDFNKTIGRIKISDEEGFFGNYCTVTDALAYVLEHSDSGVKNYVFDVYAQEDAIFDTDAAAEFLKNSENLVNISMISDFPKTITGFQREIVLDTSGININSTKDFGERIYSHVFNDFIPETMSAILISGYEYVELKGRLNKYNHIDSDYEECAEGEDDFHKNDHLTDWVEVGVDYWTDPDVGLMSYDDEGNAILPTIMDCLEFTELTYVEEGLKRFEQQLGANFGAAICGKRVLPVISDPTRADGDGDGIVDKYDPNPLMAIDVDSTCLYGKEDIPGVENHNMVVNFMNNCKTYICTNPKCGFEVANPEFEDFTNLSKTDFVMVRTLLSLYNCFCEMNNLGMADLTYAMIDRIRENCAINSYEYVDEHGDYFSPCTKMELENNDLYVSASIGDYTGWINLADTIEYMRSIRVYVTKDVLDVAVLLLNNATLSIVYAAISESFMNWYENRENLFDGENIFSTSVNMGGSIISTIFDKAMDYSIPVTGAIVTASSILSHIGIYITNAYEMLNIDNGYNNDYKIRIAFEKDGYENRIVYFYNIQDIVVRSNTEIDVLWGDLYTESCSKKSALKNAFLYSSDTKSFDPWAICGSYYYKRDYSSDGFTWGKYHSNSTIPVK